MKAAKMAIQAILLAVFFVLLAWSLWSWFDLMAHQLDGGTQNAWNLYNILRK